VDWAGNTLTFTLTANVILDAGEDGRKCPELLFQRSKQHIFRHNIDNSRLVWISDALRSNYGVGWWHSTCIIVPFVSLEKRCVMEPAKWNYNTDNESVSQSFLFVLRK
jgi:hypothetical protein